jgi:hypothetical protein
MTHIYEALLPMLLMESGLILIALLLAFLRPNAGSSLFLPVERALARLAQRRHLTIFVVGGAALGLRAALIPILPIPYPGVHDEFSYQLMADTFAHGRLTNPTHPLWTHFESITVIHQPTYCSVFYPAQGMFMALGQVMAKHPFWGVWLSAGLMCAAICWMLQGWVPAFWALIGGLLAVIRLGTFSYWANSYFGGAVPALGGALVLGALPRIKRHQRLRDAFLMGAGFAILANSRPYESIFFGIPVAAALVLWMWHRDKHTLSQSLVQIVLPLALVLTATVGFMFYYFWRTTGNPFLPPYVVNLRTYFVDPAFPWLPLRAVPQYHHEVLRNHYLGWNLSQFQFAQTHPLFSTIIKILMLWFFFLGPLLSFPFLALGMALPYGASFKDLGSKSRFLLLVCGTTLLGVLLPAYANPHYAAPLTAAFYALLVMATQRIRRWRHGANRAGLAIVRAVVVAAVVLLLVRIATPVFHLRILNSALPETWCSPWAQLLPRAQIESRLQTLPGLHLVLVHYGVQHDTRAGWVNNSAEIDKSKIVWAHDMGPAENQELIRYFANRQVWMLDPDHSPIQISPYQVPSTTGISSGRGKQ